MCFSKPKAILNKNHENQKKGKIGILMKLLEEGDENGNHNLIVIRSGTANP